MNAQDILKYGHLTVLQTVEGLPEPEWEIGGVCGRWSTKDIIAHLASFEQVLVEVLGEFLGITETPTLAAFRDTGDRFNDEQVALRSGKTAAEALAEYADLHERAMALAAQLPAETFRRPGTIAWYGPEYALDDLIVYAYYGHKREHSAQIAVFRDQAAR